jgi:hypothetical protein
MYTEAERDSNVRFTYDAMHKYGWLEGGVRCCSQANAMQPIDSLIQKPSGMKYASITHIQTSSSIITHHQ